MKRLLKMTVVGSSLTAEARREAGRLAWSAEGVTGVMNELLVGRIKS